MRNLAIRNSVMGNVAGGGVTFLDFATSKDGSYFDTGVKIHQRPDAFELKIRVNRVRPDIGASYDGIFGARNNYIYQVRVGGFVGGQSGRYEFYDSTGHYRDVYPAGGFGVWVTIRIDPTSHKVYFNDYTDSTEASRNVTLNNTAWLGDVNMTGMSWKNTPAEFDCAYLKLYTNNTWSHDYRPAIVDGFVGFWEMNSETFHPSEGIAPFIAGTVAGGVSQLGGGSKCRRVRRSYRRSCASSARFCSRRLWKEVA